MRGHPDLAGVYKVADDILGALMGHGSRLVSLDPSVRLWLYNQIARALLDEREACAKILDADAEWEPRAREYAAAIRAR